jgi:lysophospholipase L1-like esterase
VAAAAPNALIVATGYPLLFDDPDLLETQINDATTRLNCAIDKAVADAQAAGINIVYVDVAAAFDDHGIGGSGAPFINPPEAGINAFHPTPAGYVAYAAAISAALPSSWGANKEQVA